MSSGSLTPPSLPDLQCTPVTSPIRSLVSTPVVSSPVRQTLPSFPVAFPNLRSLTAHRNVGIHTSTANDQHIRSALTACFRPWTDQTYTMPDTTSSPLPYTELHPISQLVQDAITNTEVNDDVNQVELPIPDSPYSSPVPVVRLISTTTVTTEVMPQLNSNLPPAEIMPNPPVVFRPWDTPVTSPSEPTRQVVAITPPETATPTETEATPIATTPTVTIIPTVHASDLASYWSDSSSQVLSVVITTPVVRAMESIATERFTPIRNRISECPIPDRQLRSSHPRSARTKLTYAPTVLPRRTAATRTPTVPGPYHAAMSDQNITREVLSFVATRATNRAMVAVTRSRQQQQPRQQPPMLPDTSNDQLMGKYTQ